MDMNSHAMGMTSHTATATGMASSTSAASAASATSAMGMSHKMGGMGGMGGCKISMLWNWNVQDACFISTSWHITSKAMFAGSCIATVCLVLLLELLRRSVKEYDRFLVRQHAAKFPPGDGLDISRSSSTKVIVPSSGEGSEQEQHGGLLLASGPVAAAAAAAAAKPPFRPSAAQQAVRALLHTMQFAVAYFIMLLAMYYNGYIIICIFIGAYLGSFIFSWEPLSTGSRTSASQEATVCCA